MAQSFSANQYQDAFISKKLTNWEQPNVHIQRPTAQEGFTQIISTDRGHILPGVPRSHKNPWGDFVNTWDLPKKIPGNCSAVKTSRSTYAQEKLDRERQNANLVLTGQIKNETRNPKDPLIAGTSRIELTDAEKTAPLTPEGQPPNCRSGAAAPGSKMLQDDIVNGPISPQGSRVVTPQGSRVATPMRSNAATPQVDDYNCECEK